MKLPFAGPLCIVICAASFTEAAALKKGSSTKDRHMQFASWDEVNLIAHGLLQLGHGLKQHVDRTKEQLRQVMEQLHSHNRSLSELAGRLAEQRSGLEPPNLSGPHLLQVSASLRAKVEEMEQDRLRVDRALRNLEEKVDSLVNRDRTGSSINGIRSMMETQSRNINELLTKIEDQQLQLEKQKVQIQILQNQLPENKLQLKDSPHWRSILKRRMEMVPHTHSSVEPKPADKLPADCHQLYLEGQRTANVYKIQPIGSKPFEAFCQMTEEGGWTVTQRRRDGSVDFDRLWQAYKDGFGNLTGEFWLGLEKLYTIVRQGGYLLRIELEDWENHTEYTEYPFSLGSEATDYTMTLKSPVSGNLKNAISESSGLGFSTRDQDHDLKFNMSCAKHLTGGWWFTTCGQANLNGKYFTSKPRQRHERKRGIFWKPWKGRNYPLKTTTMMIRPMELEA
ncbi:angiopoietin-related protein 4-like [Rhincodon typus]|uniref:angiopoietin-related protein 4-like n=1 Tax=Rhincodon typus TaxID=259920 RepID=UPI0009A4018C|nr:angiopoietin-related protein 4-like [Rhincodon typus]